MQVVAQLELQLQKERDRLQSMMDHLNRARQQQQQQQQQQQTPPPKQSPVKTSGSRPPPAAPSSESSHLPLQQQQHHRMSPSLAALVSATMRGVMNPATAAPHHHLLLHPPTSAGAQTAMSQQSQSQSRRRLSEKPNLAPNSGKLLYINTSSSNFCWMSFFRLYYTDTIIIVIHMAGSECPVLSSSAPTRCLCVACCCARAKQIICFKKKGAVEDIRLRKRSVTERSAMDISEGTTRSLVFVFFCLCLLMTSLTPHLMALVIFLCISN